MGGSFTRLATFVMALAAACAPRVAAAAGCQLARVAELPVTMEGLTAVVSVKINGQPARLAVDSGAFFSVLSPQAAQRLDVRVTDLPQGFYLEGAVGTASARLGQAASFELDKSKFERIEFLVAGDDMGDVDGLLGQNILGRLDVEYDFANGVVRIFKAYDCGEAILAYWAKDPATVSIMTIAPTTKVDPLIYGHAMVNDLPIKVAFDTAAGRSMLKLGPALKAGAKLDAEAAEVDDAVRGIGPRSTDSYIVPFASFELGNETIKNIRLRVARSDFDRADMLLGGDFFLSHHVMVSPDQHRLYFTYNGGPVFRLDAAGVRSNPFALSAAAPKDGGEAALDADALSRRAAAAGARRDFAHATADLDRAIALKPQDAQLYYERARWRLASEAPIPAAADLETALKLDPALVDALFLRGYMRLSAGRIDGADADFAAALKAARDRPDLEMRIADAWLGAKQFERAVAGYDAWLAKYPRSFDVGDALNGRCWARALWGRDLDRALDDCNQALRRGSRLAQVLDSRGMVHLRRGEFALAIKDYDAALKLQPKLAPSLFARGLAKRKSGDAAGGAEDIAAASAIEPTIGEQMKSFGITETTVVIASNR